MKILDKYFKRRFKTVTGVKIAIAIKGPYDRIRLKRKGEVIIGQSYHFVNHGAVEKIKDANGKVLNPDGYTIFTQIFTQSMKEDIEKFSSIDVVAELESVLVNDLSKNIKDD